MIDLRAVDRCLESSDVGVKRVGDVQELADGRISVAVAGYMSGDLLGRYVLERKGREWEWIKPRKEERREDGDPLAVRK